MVSAPCCLKPWPERSEIREDATAVNNLAVPAGRPGPKSQKGELESAIRWLRTIEGTAWEPVDIYERLFRPRALDYSTVRILDVGSGPLSVFEPVAPPTADITPYDTLAADYNRAAPNKKFPIRGEMPSGRYPLVTMLNCLDHMDAPEELVDEVAQHITSHGELWVYCNIDQPFDPELHPQDFSASDLIHLVERRFRIKRCGLVREGRLFPYAWWAICAPRADNDRGGSVRRTFWIARCAVTYARFHLIRGIVKGTKLVGLRRMLPEELRF